MSKLFQVHRLNEIGMRKAENLARTFDSVLAVVEGYAPEGRELSIIKTKLEEASFFAKKAMAMQEENQEIS